MIRRSLQYNSCMAEESPTPSAAKPQELTYAPDGHLIRKRNRRRGIFYITGLLALLVSGYWWAPAAYRQAVYNITLYQCNNHDFPQGMVVFDSTNVNAPFRGPLLACEQRLREIGGAQLSGSIPPTTVYVHHRQHGKSGGVVLISAVTGRYSGLNPQPIFLQADYNLTTGPSSPNWHGQGTGLPPNVKIFGGQSDPNDDSHFTIDIIVNDQKQIIDGYVRGRFISLEKRKPSSTQPVTAPGWMPSE